MCVTLSGFCSVLQTKQTTYEHNQKYELKHLLAHLHTDVWCVDMNAIVKANEKRWLDTLLVLLLLLRCIRPQIHIHKYNVLQCVLLQSKYTFVFLHFVINFFFFCSFLFTLLSSCFAFTWTQFHHINGIRTYMYARRRAH